MAQIFLSKVMEEISNSKAEPVIREAAKKRVQVRVDDASEQLKDDFENHPVTVELKNGVNSTNISNTIGGNQRTDNLFSFIGFDAGSDPTQPIRDLVNDKDKFAAPVIYMGKDFRRGGKVVRYQFKVMAPDLERIYEVTPMPWATEISWAEKIETYIPGMASFLPRYNKEGKERPGWNEATSRSGGGIQVRHDRLRSTTFTPPKDGYFSGIMKKFIDRIRSSAR